MSTIKIMKKKSFFFFVFFYTFAFSAKTQNVWVFNFKTSTGGKNEWTEKFTREFKSSLSRYYNVVNSIDEDNIPSDNKNLETISDQVKITLDSFGKSVVNMHFYGIYTDDINSGEIIIEVTLIERKSRETIVKSISIRRGLLGDYKSRQEKIEELINSVKAEEVSRPYIKSIRESIPKISDENEDESSFILKPSSIDPREVKDIAVTTKISSLREGPKFYIKVPSDLKNEYVPYYSFDNKDFLALDGDFGKESNRISDVLYIKLVSKINGTTIGPFEKNKIFSNSIKKYISENIDYLSRSFIEVNLDGLKINRVDLCRIYASKVTLSRKRDIPEFHYNLETCKGEEDKREEACYSPFFDKLFPLHPSQKIYCNIEFPDGYKIPFEKIVPDGQYTSKDKNHAWVELTPLNPSMEVPYAVASLGGSQHDFEIFLSVGGCEKHSNGSATIIYDIDGKGLIEPKPYDKGRNPLGISAPKIPIITLSYVNGNNERIGPFRFKFDAMEIISATANKSKPPRLETSHSGDNYYVEAPGTYGWIVSWANVKSIQFGNTPDKINNSQIISLSADEILVRKNSNYWPKKDVFHFDVPNDWSDFFYYLEFKDGKKTDLIRLPITRK